MKQILVNEKCSGCGLCVVNSRYLKENVDGNAEAIEGMFIQDEDLENMLKVIEECPDKALEIIEKEVTSVAEILRKLKDFKENFTVNRVTNADVRFRVKETDFSVPSSSKEYRSDYSSESSAKSAARDEFNRLCYSESAYRPLLKKVFVEYKVNVLKPYYTVTDVDSSAYFKYNEEIRKMLAATFGEIEYLLGEKTLPEDWKDFSVYLKDYDGNIRQLEIFDLRSTSSGIMEAFKGISHTGLNDYVNGMDFDYDERYAGEGLFGKTKYKTVWHFSGFYSAAKDYINDLTWAINHVSDEIEDGAVIDVNHALTAFEKKIKIELEEKINRLEKLQLQKQN